MNRRSGNVNVITEVGYCNFCQRTRNLRSEEHRLGDLVRTIVTCETCHRTLSNSIGVAAAEPATVPAASATEENAPATEAAVEEKPKPRRAPAKRTTKAAAKPKAPPKPRSTATRQTSKKKP